MSRFRELPLACRRRRTPADRLIVTLGCLLLLAATPSSECRLSTGPDGLCAAFRLDPASADLPLGSTLQIRINDVDCTGSQPCVSCSDRRRRVRWQSSAPDVAPVDSTGLVRAERAGIAEIRLVVDDVDGAASARVTVKH